MKCQDSGEATMKECEQLEINNNSHISEQKCLHNARNLSKDKAFCNREKNGYCDKMRYCKLQASLQVGGISLCRREGMVCNLFNYKKERKKLLTSNSTRNAKIVNYESNKELKEKLSSNLLLSPGGQSIRSLPCQLKLEERRTGTAYRNENIDLSKPDMINIVTTFQREYSAYIKSLRPMPKNADISKELSRKEILQHLQPIHSCYCLSDSTFDAIKKSSNQSANNVKWETCIRLSQNKESCECKLNANSTNLPKIDDINLNQKCRYLDHSSLKEQSIPMTRNIQNQSATYDSDINENYDELGMVFSYFMKVQARPCYRTYCALSRHLKTKNKHDEKHCRLRCKHYQMYPYDQRPACSSGNVCEDTYDEFKLMWASVVERQCLYDRMFKRRSQFLKQPCLSSRETSLFNGQ